MLPGVLSPGIAVLCPSLQGQPCPHQSHGLSALSGWKSQMETAISALQQLPASLRVRGWGISLPGWMDPGRGGSKIPSRQGLGDGQGLQR